MSEDEIDKMFAGLGEFYPGSKRKRRPVDPKVEKKRHKDISTEGWESKGLLKKLPNGNVVELYSAGIFAEALGRPLVTIRLWERRGYIPKAPYRLRPIIVNGQKKPGWRMYSRAMVDSSLQIFQSRGLLEVPRIDWDRHRDLTLELFESWTKIHDQEIN